MNFFQVSCLITTIISFFGGFAVFFNNRKEKINIFWFLSSISISIWSIGLFGVVYSNNYLSALFWQHILDIGGIFIPVFYFVFILYFLNNEVEYKLFKKISYLISFVLFVLSFTKLFKVGMLYVNAFNYWINPGLLYFIFPLYFIFYLLFSFYLLFKTYKKTSDYNLKNQIKYIFIAQIIGFGGGITNFFPQLFNIYPFGNYLVAIYIVFISYAVLKHGLFNVKVIAAELLTFAIWTAILFKFFIEDAPQGKIITGGLFIFTIIAGILLIRSVIREVHQKEIFKDLSERLEVAKKQLEKKTTRLTALQNFTASITKTLDYEKIIQEIVDDIYHKLGYASALLLLISEDRKKIYPMTISENPLSGIGLKILPRPLKEYYGDFEHDDMLSIKAAKTGILQKGDSISDFISPPVPKSACSAIQIATGIKSLVAVPVKEEEKSIGVLNIFLTKPKEEIDNDELELMQTLADQVGIVMKNATLYKQLKEINEKLIEIDKLKTGMFSFVSHQIKAPISIVKGFAQLIYEGKYGKIPKKVKETIGLLKESADRLIHLTEDFLDLRRIEEGRMDYKFTDINIVDMAKSIVEELQILANQKKLELSLKTSAQEIKIKADEQRFRQVLQNLIENCIKYTEKGFVRAEIKQEENGSILFSVIDSGMGIAPDVLPTLFDQFKRAQATRTIKGTGLGLYIAKQIVQAHKGKIWAESDGEGKGSRFFVSLPVDKQD